MALTLRAGLLAAALAGTTILATPAAAAPMARVGGTSTYFAPSAFDPAADAAQWGCRWNCGWGGGWGRRGWRGGWRRDRVDAGDVVLGAVVIGGILAIANSERRRERERDVVVIDRDPRYRYRDDRRYERRGESRVGASGLDSAVDMCLDRIERDVRVDRVDDARRTASGWQVSGNLFNGSRFECRIGNNGQIDTIDYDGGFGAGDWRDPQAGAERPAAGQWDQDIYASARAGLGGTVRPDLAVQEADMARAAPAGSVRAAAGTAAMPAYPGAPIPGEDIPETMPEENGG